MSGTELIQEKISVKDKREALVLHLLIKSFQHKWNLSMADIYTLVELDKLGYNKDFFLSCVKQNYYKSEQTVINAVSKMTKMGILTYEKRGERTINQEYLPRVTSDKVILKYLVGNIPG